MTQKTEQFNSSLDATSTSFKTAPVVVKKEFNAPVRTVWAAWSNPELIKKWWGPEDYNCPVARTDFREEGKYLFAMKGTDKKIMWSTGTYQEIIPYEKIVYTDSFADENGRPVSAQEAGMEGAWKDAEDTLLVTVTFKNSGEGKTQVELNHEGIPDEEHADCVNGWSSSLNKMKTLVEKH